MALARWCHKEAEEAIVALEEFPGIERLDDSLFCGCWHKCWDDRLKVCFKKKRKPGDRSFFFVILLTPMFGFRLTSSFTAEGVEEGFPYRHYRKQSEKQRGRDPVADRRAGERLRCFFELFIHTQTEPEWLDSNYWPVQSPSLFPSLSLPHSHPRRHTCTERQTHTPSALHSGQFYNGMWKLIADDLYSQQQDSYTAGRNDNRSQ